MRTSAMPLAKTATAVIVRFVSTQAADGSIAQMIERPVRTAKVANSASVTPPQARRAPYPISTAVAQRIPQTTSRMISTVVTGWSWRPPGTRATPANAAPKANVSSGSTAPAKRAPAGAAGGSAGAARQVRVYDGRGHAG